ncbi:hypothetical protein [Sphingomonas sp. PAMC 26621]|uniref:hypothetical protein n=1 Tax=Sphingomonas sp. PAMC 26621 TaxID=1112213 RepID=UPI00028A26AB|nr:hypothetical protein [Sphingomonas sp. PAMC 26621]
MAKTASTAWVLPIAEAQIGEFRNLLADLNEDLTGLADRAYDVGYHRERMWLQPNDDGSALLIVYLEFDEGVSFAEFADKLKTYESVFTRWWTPRFERFGYPKSVGEQLLSWDGNK